MSPHLDFGGVVFYKIYNNFFQKRLESAHYKVLLATTGAIKGSFNENLHQEPGLESLFKIDDGFENFTSFTKLLKNSPKVFILPNSFI